MKNVLKTVTACTLALVMAVIAPMTDLSPKGEQGTVKAAEKSDQPLYISDILIGNAYEDSDVDKSKGMLGEEDVAAELRSKGYAILMDGGSYANLNEGAGSKSGLKVGPNHKKILLGYKTTTDPKEAITDLAVMNMRGGYSPDDYKTLLQQKMDSEIRPFVERFIATIREYRTNYKKGKNTVNHKRADTIRKCLNKFTDDDTGGQPVGDLLLNETKFEMGDAAYNKLSAAEKKNHADILTMLMQGNAQVILAIESFLSRATDTSDSTWLERFSQIKYEDLVDQVKDDNPYATTRRDINEILDKKYLDGARIIEDKFIEANELFAQADTYEEEALDGIEEREDMEVAEAPEEIEDLDDLDDACSSVYENQTAYDDASNDILRLQISTLAKYLDTIHYGDGTMLDFFRGEGEYRRIGLRSLYPIVDAMTEGQMAGVDFLSMLDFLAICVDDGEWFKKSDVDEIETVSVYAEVNREIFEPGGVALTSKAKRAGITVIDEPDPEDAVNIHPVTWVLWGLTAVAGTGAIICAVKWVKEVNRYVDETTELIKAINQNNQLMRVLQGKISAAEDKLVNFVNTYGTGSNTEVVEAVAGYVDQQQAVIEKWGNRIMDTQKETKELCTELSGQSCNETYQLFSYALTGLTVALLVFSITSTLVDISKAYNTVFLPIPKYIVDEADIVQKTAHGDRIVLDNQKVFYKAVTCTRVKGDSSIEEENYKTMLDRNDLNGDIGRQWLCLYMVKNDKGYPILADSLLFRKDGSGVPDGYETGIHEFGGRAVTNLNNKTYLFRDDAPAIHIFYKHASNTAEEIVLGAAGEKAEEAAKKDGKKAVSAEVNEEAATGAAVSGAAGSLIGRGGITASGIALGGGIGIVLGGFLGALFMFLARRKKYPPV